jgi:hypothetical protein
MIRKVSEQSIRIVSEEQDKRGIRGVSEEYQRNRNRIRRVSEEYQRNWIRRMSEEESEENQKKAFGVPE